MVRWMRSARIRHGGKFVEAVTYAKDIAAFVEKKYKAPRVNVYVDAVGQIGTIRWIVDYDDLGSFEKVQTQLLADSEYFQKIGKAGINELFIEGSVQDVVMRSM